MFVYGPLLLPHFTLIIYSKPKYSKHSKVLDGGSELQHINLSGTQFSSGMVSFYRLENKN
jgi:hypothetical protein